MDAPGEVCRVRSCEWAGDDRGIGSPGPELLGDGVRPVDAAQHHEAVPLQQSGEIALKPELIAEQGHPDHGAPPARRTTLTWRA